eukprot:scaffold34550_cov253-Isochrysis_galbana.AAC.3
MAACSASLAALACAARLSLRQYTSSRRLASRSPAALAMATELATSRRACAPAASRSSCWAWICCTISAIDRASCATIFCSCSSSSSPLATWRKRRSCSCRVRMLASPSTSWNSASSRKLCAASTCWRVSAFVSASALAEATATSSSIWLITPFKTDKIATSASISV